LDKPPLEALAVGVHALQEEGQQSVSAAGGQQNPGSLTKTPPHLEEHAKVDVVAMMMKSTA
jgi:hypothetical protein